jgi:hypothetical protein
VAALSRQDSSFAVSFSFILSSSSSLHFSISLSLFAVAAMEARHRGIRWMGCLLAYWNELNLVVIEIDAVKLMEAVVEKFTVEVRRGLGAESCHGGLITWSGLVL